LPLGPGNGNRALAQLAVEIAPPLAQAFSMKSVRYFALLLGCLTIIGCEKAANTAPAATNASPVEWALPTQAQPKLPTIQLWVGAEKISAEMALTPKQEQTGMMFRTNIAETDAMIFVLPYPQRASFWMKNCPESISAAYIDPDGTIQEIHHLEAQNTNAVMAATDNIYYVLETKEGWFDRHNIHTGMVIRTERGSLAETFHKQQP
jgi:uncharacterized membrane protein (UPF0127 family)